MRIVLAVYGSAAAAPTSGYERHEYCSFVQDALRFAPVIEDVVIWNEVNSPRFWRPQRGAAAADEGDYDALMVKLTHAFSGTGQPVPGEANVRIWYLEDGFETAVPAEKRPTYTGREVAGSLVEAGPAPTRGTRSPRDQAAQLRDAIELAYCQPAVGAFLQLPARRRAPPLRLAVGCALGGLDSSYATLKTAVNDVLTQQIDCSRFPASVR